jgi:hypothetical protein
MRSGPLRGVAAVASLALLFGLCVGHATLPADSTANRFPGNEDLSTVDPGERVVLSGTVRSVASDRTVVELETTGERVAIADLGGEPAPGDDVWLHGTVRSDGSVTADRAIVRAPWEIAYLYAVSALGAALVLAHVVRTWRVDVERLRVVPRGEDDRG